MICVKCRFWNCTEYETILTIFLKIGTAAFSLYKFVGSLKRDTVKCKFCKLDHLLTLTLTHSVTLTLIIRFDITLFPMCSPGDPQPKP